MIKPIAGILWSALLALVMVSVSARAQDALYITEFMAVNDGSLLDEDRDASDWIELFNAGAWTVDLAGWSLTNEQGHPGTWTFPSTNVPPGGFLVVFASGKNRAVAGRELHTDFQLNRAGEYLALVKPDGLSVAHEYAPAFPPQLKGVSYGVEMNITNVLLLTNGTATRWAVPRDPAGWPTDWAASGFDDTGWATGRTGVGFDARGTGIPTPGSATNLARNKPTSQSSVLDSFVSTLAVDGKYDNFTHTLAGGTSPATWAVDLGTNCSIERIVLWNRTSCCQSRLRDITVWVSDATGTQINFTSALLNPENVLGGGQLNSGPNSITLDLTQLTGGPVIGSRVWVARMPDPDLSGSDGQGNSDEPEVLSLAEVEVFGAPLGATLGELVQSDLESSMRGVNASALVRVHFTVPEGKLPPLDFLTLRMKYNDGFVAYLNGVRMASRNAPDVLAWNVTATAAHPAAEAYQFEDFDVTPFLDALVEGDNVLAIQGLNITSDDPDFLILPELTGRSLELTPGRYFAQPTPGTTNAAGYLGWVADTKFSVDRGFFETPFTVAITTATEGAEIRYTTNGAPPDTTGSLVYREPLLVEHTTVLRAWAVKAGYKPSGVDTHTYVFRDDVAGQSLATAAAAGYPSKWAGQTADYAMDKRIVGTNTAQLKAALGALPSVFFTTSVSNLFDASRGIYANPDSHGVAWERPVAMEWIGTNNETEFHVDCGLRVQGGYFRNARVTRKHSLRAVFKSQYGAGKLKHDVFQTPGAVKEFDTLVFRAGANDGYSWDAAGNTVQFLRDEFGRRLQLAMGDPGAHGRFAHLYLNGLYWGLYNVTERPNEDFSAAYLGGDAQQWDANNAGDVKNGDLDAWNSFIGQAGGSANTAGYQRLQGKDLNGVRNEAYPVYLDKINYIDYMILNMWGGNWDWPNKNFWWGRQRGADSTGFKFYTWDFENTMGNSRDRSPLEMVAPRPEIAASGVAAPHAALKNFAEYRLDFADRVQRFFFHGGLLTPEVLIDRYRQLANTVEPAVWAETARWGDDTTSSPRTQAQWLAEREWILGTYLPRRSEVVLGQFRALRLYPQVAPPMFSQFGGQVPAGFELVITHTNTSGAVWFTTDGSDPRVYGTGAAASIARIYASPVPFPAPALVRARVLSGSEWSALTEAIFYPPRDLSPLRVTEIMYHAPAAGVTNGDEFDFLELKNVGTNTLHLDGLAFTEGITFSFTNGTTLAPGGFFLLAPNAAAFAAKYPGTAVQGIFKGKLADSGETITLADAFGTSVLSITYNDRAPWPEAPDGLGFSLVPKDPDAAPAANDGAQWRASAQIGGSPGADDPAPSVLPGDRDGDGLPDDWEIAFGTLWDVPDADADPDGDGMTNREEYLAGTNPRDPESNLRVSKVSTAAESTRLEFLAVSNRTYSVLYASKVEANVWNKLADVPAHPTNRVESLMDTWSGAPARFYRLTTPRQP